MTKEEIILQIDENKKGFTQSDVELLERFAQSQLTKKDKQIEELKKQLEENQDLATVAYMQGASRKQKQLEAQIEKMKEKLKSDLISKLEELISYSTSPSCTSGMKLFIQRIRDWEIKEIKEND